MLYNYINLFNSNYSLKDFVITANEFDSDNGASTCINFFPIDNTIEKKREVKLVGDVLSIEHPYNENEVLNVAISLTGIYENEGKFKFYNKLKEKNIGNNFSPIKKFPEIGYPSNDFVLLSSKNSTIPKPLFYTSETYITLGNQKNKFNYNIFKNYYIPYYPKHIYSSPYFNFDNLYEYFSNFKIIESFDSIIKIHFLDYLIDKELYDIKYSNQSNFSQYSEIIEERLTIDEFMELLKEKK